MDEELDFSENQVISEADLEKLLNYYDNVTRNERQFNKIKKNLKGALENPQLQRYFRHNVSGHCKVVSILITESETIDELLTLLKDDQTFPKLLVGREDFYSHFFRHTLKPLVQSVIKFNHDLRVIENASIIIQKCIFAKKLKSFECFLNDHSKNETCTDKHSVCKSVIKNLCLCYDLEEVESLTTFKLVFQSFCKTYNRPNLTYRMVIIVTEIIGFSSKEHFDLSKMIKSQHCPESPSFIKSLKILNQIFDVLTQSQTDPTLKINEITFTQFLQDLIKSILIESKFPHIECYRVLEAIIDINPLIIESIITSIINYVMLSPKKSDLMCDYENLIVRVMEVFSKLHRIQNFISKFIPTIKNGESIGGKVVYGFYGELDCEKNQSSIMDVSQILPRKVLKYYSDCITNLASWQVMNLFKTLLYHLNQAVDDLPHSMKENDDLYIQILTSLMCSFIQSVRMAEHTVTSSVVDKFVCSLNELRNILSKFGSHLLQRKHNIILMRAFLDISYNWAEIYMFLAYYSINDEVKFPIATENTDFVPYNLTYLHSYLNAEQWCLISERITNFGEQPCQEIMHKLFIQKLRASMIFDDEMSEEMAGPVIKAICISSINENSLDLFLDKFVINNLIPKSSNSFILALSEQLLNNLDKYSQSFESELITNGILCVITTKINKLLKQKRKFNENSLKKPLFSRIVQILPQEIFLDVGISNYLKKSAEVLTNSDDLGQNLDIKVNCSKINEYLDVLKKMPLIYCTEDNQKLLIVLLLSLHRDLNGSNTGIELKSRCEALILGLLQRNKFTFLDVFEPQVLFEWVLSNFNRYQEIFTSFCDNIYKDDVSIELFKPAIVCLKDNLRNQRYLKCSIILLHQLIKSKKTKLSIDSKSICSEQKSVICHRIVKLISKKSPSDDLLEPYALALKHYQGNKQEGNDADILRGKLVDYFNYTIDNLNRENLRGGLTFFMTILHNKSTFNDIINAEFILKVWNCLKNVTIDQNNREDYFQLIILLTSLIPNEEFSKISQDLLKFTEESITHENYDEFFRHLKTWTGIISSNFNPTKTKLLHSELETLLQQLSLILKFCNYRDDLFDEIINFQVSIIQNTQFLLTPAMIDLFLLNVTLLMTKKIDSFVKSFTLSIVILDNLLKHRNPLILDRLPPYLQEYRLILKKLCREGDSDRDSVHVQEIAECAHKLEKLTKHLVSFSKDMMRISPYLIADILNQYEHVTLHPSVKLHLNNCLYTLISLCDQHAVSYLMRVLSNASTEMFKIMFNNYKKYYRFTGKV